jgi:ATP-dependent protease ClpP protease subunit
MPRHIIRIEGQIGVDITLQTVRRQLQMAPAGAQLVVQINSEGGSVQEATAMFAELAAVRDRLVTEVTGWALSAATMLLMAAKTRRMAPSGLLMVHAPWLSATGNSDELRSLAGALDKVKAGMQAIYSLTGSSAAQIEQWLDGKDHWFTAEQALAAGLVTEITELAEQSSALSRQALAACRFPVPSHLLERFPMPVRSGPQGHNAPHPGAPGSPDAVQAAVRAENARQAEIRAAFRAYGPREPDAQAAAQALLETCLANPATTLEQAKAQLLEVNGSGTTPLAGHYHVRFEDNTADSMREFIEAATDTLVMRAGVRLDEPHPAARDLKTMRLTEIASRILSMRGQSTQRLSQAEIINASLSASDFVHLLANVAGKSLRTGYMSEVASFRGWTGQREVADFKPQTLVMLGEAPSLLEVLPGAEYKNGSLSDSASTFAVKTHGRILQLTRQALVNDDLGAFTSLPAAIGKSAVRLEGNLVYELLTANANLNDGFALFSAQHGNVSAAGEPSLATLGAARAAMRKQRGIEGIEYIDPQPRWVIAPVALQTTFEQLLASLVDPTKSNDTPNVEWVRNLQLACDPRLDATSASAWYLAASPDQIEGVIRAYLPGGEVPRIVQDEEFRRDVVSMRCSHDLATGVVDFRALHRVG